MEQVIIWCLSVEILMVSFVGKLHRNVVFGERRNTSQDVALDFSQTPKTTECPVLRPEAASHNLSLSFMARRRAACLALAYV
jgi:hypothetical protein